MAVCSADLEHAIFAFQTMNATKYRADAESLVEATA
jgi:hypothetical protein